MTTRPLTIPGEGSLHIWRFDLDTGIETGIGTDWAGASDAIDDLTPDEHARSDRFHFDRDRTRYVRGRRALRQILGRYLDTEPGAIRFLYNAQGKPALDLSDARGPALEFNLAHSDQHALLAITHAECLIGVDLEHVREGFAADTIAERFFAPQETAALRALPHADQQLAFFRCWTRKEAYIKACGGGLQIPLDSFRVAFEPDAAPALLWAAGVAEAPTVWTMLDLSDYTPGCIAAVALRSQLVEVPTLFDLDG